MSRPGDSRDGDLAGATAKLIRRGRLRRAIEVALPDGPHVVEYNGAGFGSEQVSADGRVVRHRSWLWFAPRFDFELGGRPAAVDVRVWPWLSIRSLVLQVGSRVVYAEGARDYGVEDAGDRADQS